MHIRPIICDKGAQTIQWQKESLFNKWYGENRCQHAKNETGPLSYSICKVNSEWFKDLNAKTVTIKILEETKRGKLLGINLHDDFLRFDTKSKNKQVGLYQTKSL